MGRESLGQTLRPEKTSFSYAESEGSTSPGAASDASSFTGSPQSSKSTARTRSSGDSDDEIQQDEDDDVDELHSDDVIHGEYM